MENNQSIITPALTGIVAEIKTVLDSARRNVARQVNSELLNAYWNIGRIISEYEQTEPERADYGKQTLKELAKVLTAEFGKGFSRANLQNMHAFYLTYEKCQTLSGKLSWTHYCDRTVSRIRIVVAENGVSAKEYEYLNYDITRKALLISAMSVQA